MPDWLLDKALQAGIAIDGLSFIATKPIQSIEVQKEIENTLLKSATVVFTSMNAVEAVATQLSSRLPKWSIFCIGTTTHKLVKQFFGEASVAGTASSAAELANVIAADRLVDEVVFFCGDQRRDELPEILNRHHIDVNEVVVYQTMAEAHEISKAYHGILFFSPSAADSFFSKNKLPESTVLFAIGNTTAAEIKKHTNNKIIISDEPGKENLVNKMIGHFT
jgi:uroporphyrinogen-III synthase